MNAFDAGIPGLGFSYRRAPLRFAIRSRPVPFKSVSRTGYRILGVSQAKPLRGTPGSVLTCATTTRNRVLVFKMTTYTCSLPWFVRLEVPYAILVHLLSLGPFGGFPPYLWCRFPTSPACALPNWTVSASRFPMRVNHPEECSCR